MMAWVPEVEQHPELDLSNYVTMFEEDVPRHREAEQQVVREVRALYEADDRGVMAWAFGTEYKNSDTGTYFSPDIVRIEPEHERFRAMGAVLVEVIEAKWMAGDRNRNSPDYPFYGASG